MEVCKIADFNMIRLKFLQLELLIRWLCCFLKLTDYKKKLWIKFALHPNFDIPESNN
jgi:hypothetical protein